MKIVLHIARFLHPLPGLSGAGAHDDHPGAVGIGVVLQRVDRLPVIPDVVQGRVGHVVTVEGARQTKLRSCAETQLIRGNLEGQIDASGVVVAGFPGHVRRSQWRVDPPLPAENGRRLQVDLKRSTQECHALLCVCLNSDDAIPGAQPVLCCRHPLIKMFEFPPARQLAFTGVEFPDPLFGSQERPRQEYPWQD